LKFEIGQCAEFFMDKFEAESRIKKWTEEQKCCHLCLTLPEESKTWYMSLKPEEKENFEYLRNAFLDRFGNQETDFSKYDQFINLKQNNRPVRHYIEQLRELGRQLKKSDDTIFSQIVLGLNGEMREMVFLRDAKTVEEIVRAEQTVKDVMKGRETQVTVASAQQSDRDENVDSNNGQKCRNSDRNGQKSRNSGLNGQNKRQNYHEQKRCKCCGKYGHIYSECRFRNATCFECRKKGHLARTHGFTNRNLGKKYVKQKVTKERQNKGKSDQKNKQTIGKTNKVGCECNLVDVRLGKFSTAAMIDSGASISCLSLNMFNLKEVG